MPGQTRRDAPLLWARNSATPPASAGEREPWFAAFVELLVRHGANETVTLATVDRLADLFAVTLVGWWEHAARCDPVVAGWACDSSSAQLWHDSALLPMPPRFGGISQTASVPGQA